MSQIKKHVVIHASLGKVIGLARDPKRWGEWYCGSSGEKVLACGTSSRRLEVGMRFPLTQKVLEDWASAAGARWRVRSTGPLESVQVESDREFVLLPGEQVWDYRPSNGNTEVRVEVDFDVPPKLADRGAAPAEVDRLEAETLEHTLANLRALCEAA
jgi:Polyketide cyclase / dehydrase and lipid transport